MVDITPDERVNFLFNFVLSGIPSVSQPRRFPRFFIAYPWGKTMRDSRNLELARAGPLRRWRIIVTIPAPVCIERSSPHSPPHNISLMQADPDAGGVMNARWHHLWEDIAALISAVYVRYNVSRKAFHSLAKGYRGPSSLLFASALVSLEL